MKSIVEGMMLTLSQKMTEQEFSTLAGILARVNAREEK